MKRLKYFVFGLIVSISVGVVAQTLFSGVEIRNTTPVLTLNETDGSVGNKKFVIQSSGETSQIGVALDNGGSFSPFMSFDHNQNTPDSITLHAPLYAIGGLSPSPGYTFTSDTDTGMFSTASGQVGFLSNGSGRLVISTSDVEIRVPITDSDSEVTVGDDFLISSTTPLSFLDETDAAANNGLWGIEVEGTGWNIFSATDAGVRTPFISAFRNGPVDTLQLGESDNVDNLSLSSLQVNVYSQAGAGSANITQANVDSALDTNASVLRLTTNDSGTGAITLSTWNKATVTPIDTVLTGTFTESSGSFTDITLDAPTITLTGDVTVSGSCTGCGGETGNFDVLFDTGCTVDPTITFNFTKVGNIMQLRGTSNISCTGNATTMTAAAGTVPAAYRPSVNQYAISNVISVTDNSSAVDACVRFLSDGGVEIVRGTWGNPICNTSWVASGTRAVTFTPHSLSYSLN